MVYSAVAACYLSEFVFLLCLGVFSFGNVISEGGAFILLLGGALCRVWIGGTIDNLFLIL